MTGRVLLAASGVAGAAYGVVLAARLDRADLLDAGLWLVAGVVVHDAVVAPLVLAVVALATRLLPRRGRTPVAVAAVVLATVTVTAVPVLGRFGARPDNPTLLDRDYTAGWLLLCAVVVAGAVLGGVARRVSGRAGSPPGRPRPPRPPRSRSGPG